MRPRARDSETLTCPPSGAPLPGFAAESAILRGTRGNAWSPLWLVSSVSPGWLHGQIVFRGKVSKCLNMGSWLRGAQAFLLLGASLYPAPRLPSPPGIKIKVSRQQHVCFPFPPRTSPPWPLLRPHSTPRWGTCHYLTGGGPHSKRMSAHLMLNSCDGDAAFAPILQVAV